MTGLSGDDYVLRDSVPEWLPAPIRRWLRDLTYNEWHMVVLGLIGLPIGGAWATGGPIVRTLLTAFVGTVIVATLHRPPEGSTPTSRLLGRESWYFTVPFTLFVTLGWLCTRLLL